MRWPSVCEDHLAANFSATACRLSAGLKAAMGPVVSDRTAESPPSPTAGLGPIVLPWRQWCYWPLPRIRRVEMYTKSVPTSAIEQSKHAAGTGSLFPYALVVFYGLVIVSHPLTGCAPPPIALFWWRRYFRPRVYFNICLLQPGFI